MNKIVFFDPFSYTWHFNKHVVDNFDNKIIVYPLFLLTKDIKKNKLIRLFYAIFFYVKIILLNSFNRIEINFWNISFLPIFDCMVLIFLKIIRKKNVLILHNTLVNHGNYKSIRNLGYNQYLMLFDKIICHDNIENISNIINKKTLEKIEFIDFPKYNYSNLKRKKSKLFTIGFAGIISKNKNIEILPKLFKNLPNELLKKCDLKIIGKNIYDISNVITELKQINSLNLKVENNLLSDEEFNSEIFNCDLMLMPYLFCSGSALLSQCQSMGIPTMCSKISFFNDQQKKDKSIILCDYNLSDFQDKLIYCMTKVFSNKNNNKSTIKDYCDKIIQPL